MLVYTILYSSSDNHPIVVGAFNSIEECKEASEEYAGIGLDWEDDVDSSWASDRRNGGYLIQVWNV